MTLTGPVMKFGVHSHSGRVYDETALRKAVADYAGKIKNSAQFGTVCNAISTPSVTLANATHTVKAITIEQNTVNVELDILDNGQVIADMIATNAKLYASLTCLTYSFDKVIKPSEILSIDIDCQPTYKHQQPLKRL